MQGDRHSARRLVVGVVTLFVLDLVGGLLAVANDVNTAAEAWSSTATLAAPWPMIVAQAVLTAIAVRSHRRPAVVAAVLLALACLVSGVSGFFDGQLAKEGLAPWLVGFQLLLVTVTVGVGVLALDRLRHLVRRSSDTPR